MTNILITGGAGFIGSHITDYLCNNALINDKIVIIDNLSTGNVNNINKNAISVIGNINDTELLNNIFYTYKFDYVFHLAAQINLRKSILNPREDAETNIMGGLAIIEKCTQYKIKKLIFSSTGGAIYNPDANLPFTENTDAKPTSPYGLCKLTIEKYLEINKSINNLDYVALRYSNVFGPRQNPKSEAGVISIFINELRKGNDITIFGDGNQTRDFVYVEDVVKANMLAMNLSGTYNVSTNIETSINNLASMLISNISPSSKIIYAPAVNGEMTRCCLSSEKLMSVWWAPAFSLDEGLKKMISCV